MLTKYKIFIGLFLVAVLAAFGVNAYFIAPRADVIPSTCFNVDIYATDSDGNALSGIGFSITDSAPATFSAVTDATGHAYFTVKPGTITVTAPDDSANYTAPQENAIQIPYVREKITATPTPTPTPTVTIVPTTTPRVTPPAAATPGGKGKLGSAKTTASSCPTGKITVKATNKDDRSALKVPVYIHKKAANEKAGVCPPRPNTSAGATTRTITAPITNKYCIWVDETVTLNGIAYTLDTSLSTNPAADIKPIKTSSADPQGTIVEFWFVPQKTSAIIKVEAIDERTNKEIVFPQEVTDRLNFKVAEKTSDPCPADVNPASGTTPSAKNSATVKPQQTGTDYCVAIDKTRDFTANTGIFRTTLNPDSQSPTTVNVKPGDEKTVQFKFKVSVVVPTGTLEIKITTDGSTELVSNIKLNVKGNVKGPDNYRQTFTSENTPTTITDLRTGGYTVTIDPTSQNGWELVTPPQNPQSVNIATDQTVTVTFKMKSNQPKLSVFVQPTTSPTAYPLSDEDPRGRGASVKDTFQLTFPGNKNRNDSNDLLAKAIEAADYALKLPNKVSLKDIISVIKGKNVSRIYVDLKSVGYTALFNEQVLGTTPIVEKPIDKSSLGSAGTTTIRGGNNNGCIVVQTGRKLPIKRLSTRKYTYYQATAITIQDTQKPEPNPVQQSNTVIFDKQIDIINKYKLDGSRIKLKHLGTVREDDDATMVARCINGEQIGNDDD